MLPASTRERSEITLPSGWNVTEVPSTLFCPNMGTTVTAADGAVIAGVMTGVVSNWLVPITRLISAKQELAETVVALFEKCNAIP